MTIETVTEGDLPDLLPLMRGYCDFYEVSPADDELLALSRSLIADPEHEGVQLIASDADGKPVGFATVFWTWSTLSASRIGVMNDLFVHPDARGSGVAEALHAIIGHRRRGDPLTIEAGVVRVADALDMEHGRSRVPFEAGRPICRRSSFAGARCSLPASSAAARIADSLNGLRT